MKKLVKFEFSIYAVSCTYSLLAMCAVHGGTLYVCMCMCVLAQNWCNLVWWTLEVIRYSKYNLDLWPWELFCGF